MTLMQRLMAIQAGIAALATLPATLAQMAADIAAIKAAQGQAHESAVLPIVTDIKAIVINIQTEIGSE